MGQCVFLWATKQWRSPPPTCSQVRDRFVEAEAEAVGLEHAVVALLDLLNTLSQLHRSSKALSRVMALSLPDLARALVGYLG